VWDDEIYTLDKFSGLRHDNLIEKIAAIKRGQQHCLMFLWAEGNLREFWQTFRPLMSASLVKDIILQLRGMADVLEKLHNPEGPIHSRHGDIKPENILRFPWPDKSRIGLFKISDLGSAKHHAVVTRLRGKTVGGRWATKVYEPPESMTNKLGATPRLYDIWSMGCVTLEWMIWLLYGDKELTEFKKRLEDSFRDPDSFFICQDVEEVREGSIITRSMAHIHPAVQGCFQDMSNDKECKNDTALRDLLDIVMNKLLVVELPVEKEASVSSDHQFHLKIEDSSDQRPRAAKTRATAKEFVHSLDAILKHENASSDSYWFTGQSREGARLPGTVINVREAVDGDNSSRLSPGWTPISGQPHRRKESSSSLSKGSFLRVKTDPIQDVSV
jgi:serine/threonine protein kinase